MCQLDFEGFNNKPKNVVDIIPFKKEYLNDNSNIVNNKENKYKVLSNVNNITKNKSGVLLKKLNIPENTCNDIDKETIICQLANNYSTSINNFPGNGSCSYKCTIYRSDNTEISHKVTRSVW